MSPCIGARLPKNQQQQQQATTKQQQTKTQQKNPMEIKGGFA